MINIRKSFITIFKWTPKLPESYETHIFLESRLFAQECVAAPTGLWNSCSGPRLQYMHRFHEI